MGMFNTRGWHAGAGREMDERETQRKELRLVGCFQRPDVNHCLRGETTFAALQGLLSPPVES